MQKLMQENGCRLYFESPGPFLHLKLSDVKSRRLQSVNYSIVNALILNSRWLSLFKFILVRRETIAVTVLSKIFRLSCWVQIILHTKHRKGTTVAKWLVFNQEHETKQLKSSSINHNTIFFIYKLPVIFNNWW